MLFNTAINALILLKNELEKIFQLKELPNFHKIIFLDNCEKQMVDFHSAPGIQSQLQCFIWLQIVRNWRFYCTEWIGQKIKIHLNIVMNVLTQRGLEKVLYVKI